LGAIYELGHTNGRDCGPRNRRFPKNFLAKIIGRRNILLSLEVIHEVEEIFGSYYGLRTDAALGSGRRPI
jgi:hypothetical protein